MGKIFGKYLGGRKGATAIFATLFLVLAWVAVATAAAPVKATVWRMDWVLPAGDPETLMLKQAADDIFEFTEGRLKIEVYPSFSLKLNPGKQLTNLRDGLCEAACLMTQTLEGQDASLAVTEAPGVWANKADQAKAVDALKPFKTKQYREAWGSHYVATKMMTAQVNGIFSAKKPIKSLADLKGFKMRVPSRRQMKPFQEIGAAPQTMNSGEVYMALKTGVLDGASSGSRVLIYQKWAEVVKYALEGNPAEAIAQDIVVNQKAWDGIPKDVQEIVTMVFTALGEKQKMMAVMPGMSNHWRRQCEALGIEYTTFSPADLKKLEDANAEEWFEDLKKANAKTKEAWDIVKPFTRSK